jgi:hypothetical protein
VVCIRSYHPEQRRSLAWHRFPHDGVRERFLVFKRVGVGQTTEYRERAKPNGLSPMEHWPGLSLLQSTTLRVLGVDERVS